MYMLIIRGFSIYSHTQSLSLMTDSLEFLVLPAVCEGLPVCESRLSACFWQLKSKKEIKRVKGLPFYEPIPSESCKKT